MNDVAKWGATELDSTVRTVLYRTCTVQVVRRAAAERRRALVTTRRPDLSWYSAAGHSITAHLFSRDAMNGLLIRILVLGLLAVSQAAPIDVNYTAKSIANDAQCCQSCKWPHDKYYSVDAPHGFCGEACIIPALYPIFKNFEKNLTMASSRSEPACARQLLPDGRLFNIYTKTVTHGIPGLLSVTLDLYAPG